jgi:hypothetical protein
LRIALFKSAWLRLGRCESGQGSVVKVVGCSWSRWRGTK